MEPQEIKILKHKLESTIFDLCKVFENETQTNIDYIHTDHIKQMGIVKPELVSIRLDVTSDYLFND